MKFLGKDPASAIKAAGAVYREAGHNDELLRALLREQRGFCAYSEQVASSLDTLAVEHFDRDLKATAADGYDNYYAVLQLINQRKRKREAPHRGAAFFKSRFFQDPAQFQRRVEYVAVDRVYAERNDGDAEARDLIDYLGFNDSPLFERRRKHVRRLAGLFRDAGWGKSEQLKYFRGNPEELTFITALEAELGLDLSEFLVDEPPSSPR